ncbi:hypothetical protein [Paenibacillus sp. Soil766]|uniref:hypothetical protein n=1 Tax=Paenibacillus sp. Soil766 TaxID=1736404 RepID=UPI0012F8BFED|nr:hypothetical protein [Paenibacillus sp. Soil766]
MRGSLGKSGRGQGYFGGSGNSSISFSSSISISASNSRVRIGSPRQAAVSRLWLPTVSAAAAAVRQPSPFSANTQLSFNLLSAYTQTGFSRP